jgi:ParB-like chromosome segregation protein Spo0J
VSGQLTLLPTTAPELRRETLLLDVVEGFEDAAPSAKLRELIRDLGLLQPIVVAPARSGRFRVVEGRRRCKAITQLAEARDWPVPARVDALVIEGPQAARREVRGGLTLALHASRSASPASELQAIETILQTGVAESEAVTANEIAAQTGMSLQTVRRRLRLRALTPALRAAFDGGAITAGAAEAAARLSEAHQKALERQLEEAGRLTLADVRQVAREQTTAATTDLPEGLFEQHAVAWQVTVRGHLTAALHAIPSDTEHEQLQRVIGDALAAAETADAEPDA